ncbi:alpha/beta hydrolase [Acidobacteriota bacterium]
MEKRYLQKKTLLFQIIVLICLLNLMAFPQYNISIGKTYSIHSKVLDENRTLLILLPTGYDQSDESYPVLYLLDAKSHFIHVSGIVNFLSWDYVKRIPKMIVVAIVNTQRGRDFSPAEWPGYDYYTGGGDNFIRFLNEDLFPFINQTFRTQNYKILVGHSLAGTFTLYSFLTRPELFDGYISLSPAVFWHDRIMLKKMDIFLEQHTERNRFLYIAHEYKEGSPASTMTELENALQKRSPKGLQWISVLKDKDDHFSYIHKAIYEGLEFIFKKKD